MGLLVLAEAERHTVVGREERRTAVAVVDQGMWAEHLRTVVVVVVGPDELESAIAVAEDSRAHDVWSCTARTSAGEDE